MITYPEITKNKSTPKNPPGIHESPKWYRTTAVTAIARRPSIDEIWRTPILPVLCFVLTKLPKK